MSKIEFREVCKRYTPQSALTINNANLTIENGEFCVFVGPSGCGKSTLLRMVAGLEDISAGDIYIGGERVNELPPARRGVAMVFQSYALYPHMTVRENMGFGLKVFGSNAAEIDKKVREAAEILQLTHLLDRLPKALSGGQRQRVAIGRAIVKEPRVFLFDEPLSNLDAALRVQTRLEIAKLHHGIGTASMIYVTHDQVEAMTLADKIVLLRAGDDVQKKGSIAQVGSPLTLYHRPASLFVAEFIGSPKMNILPGVLEQAAADRSTLQVMGAPFAAAVDTTRLANGAAICLGVRPEDMHLCDAPGQNVISGQVEHVEKLGDSSLLYIMVSAKVPLLTIKIEGTANQTVGSIVHMQCPPDSLHVFDAEGDACLRTPKLPA
ncbi:MAG: sn-glycerol-3-phosphate ABC transporter ATP-binding protein UgpC [Rhodoferax sp.]|jgi:multiple sugar transport system ATP-binding protein|uniref:ABC transporter ATP-binding protein n=1 Tax=Rhodoferax sp. TaxID=50421 RepID=UPI001B6A00CC|nr:sn-glycerol-3-phosphate ABC transporter ATP-binding protein UgpC [Rhodoferax sp.]MBP9147182.1 sn-glycerol-3-phosphate ABC transporter ATP-binding protein UgpC [Rhodoferax sp.]MBP9734168.1 sn-glycerol-3-phosphate ABC transporter ATP-binding protein UgpC [Rhodoferax sp.]